MRHLLHSKLTGRAPRLTALLLAAILLCSLCAPAYAAQENASPALAWAAEMGLADESADAGAVCDRAEAVSLLWRLAAAPEAGDAALNLTDVAPGDEYYPAVCWAAGTGVTNGTGEGLFQPESVCTRAQFATLLYRFAGQPRPAAAAACPDVPEDVWYSDAVGWLAEKGLMGAADAAAFRPDEPCTYAGVLETLYEAIESGGAYLLRYNILSDPRVNRILDEACPTFAALRESDDYRAYVLYVTEALGRQFAETGEVSPALSMAALLWPAVAARPEGQDAAEAVKAILDALEQRRTSVWPQREDVEALLLAAEADFPGATLAMQTVYAADWLRFADYSEYYRIDRDSPDVQTGPLENLRLFTTGAWKLGKAKAKYGMDTSYIPSTEGLDTLRISGSAQFSAEQFRTLVCDIRAHFPEGKIVVVDLRQESHFFVDGTSVSWYGLHNWGNRGKTPEEVRADEDARSFSAIGQTIRGYTRSEGDDELPENPVDLTVGTVMSEQALAESEGCEYLRINCTDHCWPSSAEIDRFIRFVSALDPEQTWLHFHCSAGNGRTGIFMMLYDKMKNPSVSDKDILYRQAMTGSSSPLFLDPDNYKAPLSREKNRMMPLLFQYVEEQSAVGYAVSWTDWLSARNG